MPMPMPVPMPHDSTLQQVYFAHSKGNFIPYPSPIKPRRMRRSTVLHPDSEQISKPNLGHVVCNVLVVLQVSVADVCVAGLDRDIGLV